jgi:hypothetical protein
VLDTSTPVAPEKVALAKMAEFCVPMTDVEFTNAMPSRNCPLAGAGLPEMGVTPVAVPVPPVVTVAKPLLLTPVKVPEVTPEP